jgi:hypothetical protein
MRADNKNHGKRRVLPTSILWKIKYQLSCVVLVLVKLNTIQTTQLSIVVEQKVFDFNCLNNSSRIYHPYPQLLPLRHTLLIYHGLNILHVIHILHILHKSLMLLFLHILHFLRVLHIFHFLRVLHILHISLILHFLHIFHFLRVWHILHILPTFRRCLTYLTGLKHLTYLTCLTGLKFNLRCFLSPSLTAEQV